MKYCVGSVSIFIFLLTVLVGNVVAESKIPVIYCSDLFHPHDDPDDHFDLVCMYAIPEFDIKAIILDQGKKQLQKPGQIPIDQMNYLTGRNIPGVIGLAEALQSPEDKGTQQEAVYQKGVETLLTILRESDAPVTVIAVGSLRDVAAAYNREPELVRSKMHRLYAFIGEAQASFQEYNVGLDVNAYRCIMNSGLPVYWVPCFDGGVWVNEGNASFWQAKHEALLEDASDPVLNFFTYMILEKTANDHVAAIYEAPLKEEKEKMLAELRNLWCCALFPYMADRKYVHRDGEYLAVTEEQMLADDSIVEPFSFLPVKVRVDEKGLEVYEDNGASQTVHRFHVNDSTIYPTVMTSVTRNLLRELSEDIASQSEKRY